MEVRMLFTDPTSGNGACDTVYVGETGEFVIQGQQIDAATLGELKNVLPGEVALRIAPEVVLGAVDRYRAEQATG